MQGLTQVQTDDFLACGPTRLSTAAASCSPHVCSTLSARAHPPIFFRDRGRRVGSAHSIQAILVDRTGSVVVGIPQCPLCPLWLMASSFVYLSALCN